MKTTDYHTLRFDREDEAAALLAALSRYLDSPVGAKAQGGSNALSIRGRVTGQSVELYLNDSALAAVGVAFSPLPQVTPCAETGMPADTSSLLTGKSAPCGLDEARKLLRQRLGPAATSP